MVIKAIAIFLILISSASCASDWTTIDNGLFYRGVVIGTKFDISEINSNNEVGMLFEVKPNLDTSYSLLKVMSSKGEIEIWLFDNEVKNNPLLVDVFPVDMNIFWYSDKYFSAFRKSMGTSVSTIYRLESANQISKSAYIKNLLHFDSSSGITARLEVNLDSNGQSSINFSKLFSDSESKFEVNLAFDYPTSILGNMKSTRLSGCEFEFNYEDRGNASIQQITIPDELCL
tara:strand:- start:274 stop:963 length:690 start_codon:yes stop_codon:yes gene_type:complete